MNYYINKNKVLITDADYSISNRVSDDFNDSYEAFVLLNEEQVSFYLSNPNLSTREIFLMRENPPIQPDPSAMISSICSNYNNAELSNITAVGLYQLNLWCDAGVPKALSVRQWLFDLYAERTSKLNSINAGDYSISLEPSQPNKPYTFFEMDPSNNVVEPIVVPVVEPIIDPTENNTPIV